MKDRYQALRTVSGILRIIGWLQCVGGVLCLCGKLQELYGTSNQWGLAQAQLGALYSLAAIVSGLVMVAGSDLAQVLMDIEANSRAIGDVVKSQVSNPQPSIGELAGYKMSLPKE